MSHTPGPWKLCCEQYGKLCVKDTKLMSAVALLAPRRTYKMGDYVSGFAVADLIEEEPAASAYLIAAAPDLLEACKAANQLLSKIATTGSVPEVDEWSTVQQALAQSIAKAEGRV